MAPIKGMFTEVQYELAKIILLNVFLSTVILFLIADLVALMFGMPLWYVIIIAFIYFVIVLFSEIRKISVKQVEESNPDLKEMLRTAKDNEDQDSLMAHALFFDVLEKMRRVSSGTFIDFKKLMMKLGAIFVLAIVLVTLTFFNVNIQKFDNPLAGSLSALGGFFRGTDGQFPEGDVGAAGDIFGDAKMADLGSDQLVATVNPSLDSPDFSQVGEASPSNDPLANLDAEGDAGFQTGEGYTREGISDLDLERSYKYAQSTQD